MWPFLHSRTLRQSRQVPVCESDMQVSEGQNLSDPSNPATGFARLQHCVSTKSSTTHCYQPSLNKGYPFRHFGPPWRAKPRTLIDQIEWTRQAVKTLTEDVHLW